MSFDFPERDSRARVVRHITRTGVFPAKCQSQRHCRRLADFRGVIAAGSQQVYNCADMLVEWDPVKARSNARKHGVQFADAVAVLEDDRALTMRDPSVHEEERWGDVGSGRVRARTRGSVRLARRIYSSDLGQESNGGRAPAV